MKEYIVTNYINDSNGDTIGERRFTIPQETVNEIRADERARMLEPYDVESIEELIQNVRNKTIEEYDDFIAKNKGTIDYTTNRPCVKIDGLRIFAKESFMEQRKGIRNDRAD